MANLGMKTLFGYNIGINDGFGIQIHLTTTCDQNCKHCYMYNSELYEEQVKKTLDKEQWLSLLEEINQFANKHNIKCGVAITGGDPILSPYFWDVLEYLSNCEMLDVYIMGNPFHINESVASRLKKLDVKSYQISLDGMEERHDLIRRKGCFKEAIRALKIIHNNGLKSAVMLTVMKSNKDEILPLYRYLDGLGFIDIFSFDKMIPIGNASDNSEFLSKEEYHNLMFNFYKEIIINNYNLGFSFKENLWKLLFSDLGLIDPIEDEKIVLNGCMALNATVTILSNGDVMPCRKMEINIGKYPEDNFENILKKNELIHELRNFDNYEGCNCCELKAYCRGCLALRYAVNKDMFSKDVYCWRERNSV